MVDSDEEADKIMDALKVEVKKHRRLRALGVLEESSCYD
jgi:hypothetical protein